VFALSRITAVITRACHHRRLHSAAFERTHRTDCDRFRVQSAGLESQPKTCSVFFAQAAHSAPLLPVPAAKQRPLCQRAGAATSCRCSSCLFTYICVQSLFQARCTYFAINVFERRNSGQCRRRGSRGRGRGTALESPSQKAKNRGSCSGREKEIGEASRQVEGARSAEASCSGRNEGTRIGCMQHCSSILFSLALYSALSLSSH